MIERCVIDQLDPFRVGEAQCPHRSVADNSCRCRRRRWLGLGEQPRMVICCNMCINFAFFLVILATSILLPAAPATPSWDAPFSGNTGAILEESRRVPVPDGQGAVVLLEDHKYTIDRNSRTTTTIRKVFRILQQDA